MQREPLTPELDTLWRTLWEEWQNNDEEDIVLDTDKLEEIEADIPALKGRVKTALAYLQRAYYIQYRSGVVEDGLYAILYDVYEPK